MADHQSLGIEARALLDVLAEKLTAASREAPPAAAAADAAPDAAAADDHPVRCTGCPLCATLTYLHDHRELSAQLAQGALLIVGAVRQYLEQPPAAPTPPAAPPSTASSRPPDPSRASVQRIDIT